jgi:hypothetical protein
VHEIAHYPFVPLLIDGEHRRLPDKELEDLRLFIEQWDKRYEQACCVMHRVIDRLGLTKRSLELGAQEIQDTIMGPYLVELFDKDDVPCLYPTRKEECLRKHNHAKFVKAARPLSILTMPTS